MVKKEQDEVISDFRKKHGELYNYDKVNYISAKDNVTIGCSVHGDFQQTPNGHLNGRGCFKCGHDRRGKDRRKTTEEFIEGANIVHNNFYSYPRTEYVKATEIVIITCPIHGDFNKKANHHLSGRGCVECVKDRGGFSRTAYINKAKGRDTILYLIECSSEDEKFYKIGRTFQTIERRYAKGNIPYEYKLIYKYVSDAGHIFDLENLFKNKYKQYKYEPKKYFGGISECFNMELPIDKIEL